MRPKNHLVYKFYFVNVCAISPQNLKEGLKTMQNLTHLDVYMRLWMERKQYPETDADQLNTFARWLVGMGTSLRSNAILAEVPERYRMAKWLKRKGYSQKYIAQLMEISDAAVSQYIGKKDPENNYINMYLVDYFSEAKPEELGMLRIPIYSYLVKPKKEIL